MRSVVYSMSVSLDGYIAGPDGEIDWSVPDEELHRFHNDRVRDQGIQLLGRRLYETMLYWETADQNPSAHEVELEFARIWKPLPKVVFSRTLDEVEGNARLLSDGAVEEVPQAIIGQVADGGAIALATVDRGVTRLCIGRVVGGAFGTTCYSDAAVAVLPGFAKPRAFSF